MLKWVTGEKLFPVLNLPVAKYDKLHLKAFACFVLKSGKIDVKNIPSVNFAKSITNQNNTILFVTFGQNLHAYCESVYFLRLTSLAFEKKVNVDV